MLSFAELRSEAETLAGQLPAFGVVDHQLASSRAGSAPRQRSGHGEEFWQFRSHTPEDAAAAIDWRRSATSDEYFIREQELHTARLLELWADPAPGFDWSSRKELPSKADRARIMLTALAMKFCETGDMAGVIDGVNGAAIVAHSPGRMVDDFLHLSTPSLPGTPRPETSTLIIASDFYAPIGELEDWVKREAAEGRFGILLQITDPVEAAFPYQGRIRFHIPGTKLEKVFGRSESMREAYMERFEARKSALRELAASVGWYAVHHSTGDAINSATYELMQLIAPMEAQG